MKRIALLQAAAAPGDKAANLEQVRRAAGAAGHFGADVLVLPELFLTGYNIGPLARALAEPLDGPSLRLASDIARLSRCALVIGLPELSPEGVFNTAVMIDASGNRLAAYRKMHLFGPAEKAVFQRGTDLTVVDFGGTRVALGICYDIEFPEFCRALAREGAEVILAPTANMDPYWEVPTTLVRARALENGVTIAYANHCGEENGMRYTGLSAITGAHGVDLARAGRDGEALLIAEWPDRHLLPPPSTQLRDLKL